MVHCDKGEHEKALDYFERCLEMRKKVCGEEHPDIGDSLNNIGIAYSRLGEHTKAINFFDKSLMIRKKYLGD